jgi:hypothetical protein
VKKIEDFVMDFEYHRDKKKENLPRFSNLTCDYKNELIYLILEIYGDQVHDFLVENNNLNLIMYHLRKYAISLNKQFAVDLAETLLLSAIDYYTVNLDYVFEEIAYINNASLLNYADLNLQYESNSLQHKHN